MMRRVEKKYHVAKANMQPPPGEEQGRSLGVKLVQTTTYL